MFKKSVYIPILLLVFILLQVNNINCHVDNSYSKTNFEYKDYIKDKTLSENFKDHFLQNDNRESLSNFKQKYHDDDSLCLISISKYINESFKELKQENIKYLAKHLYSTLNSRAPPSTTLFS